MNEDGEQALTMVVSWLGPFCVAVSDVGNRAHIVGCARQAVSIVQAFWQRGTSFLWCRYGITAVELLFSSCNNTAIKQTVAMVYPGRIGGDNAAIDEPCRQSWPVGSVCVCMCE